MKITITIDDLSVPPTPENLLPLTGREGERGKGKGRRAILLDSSTLLGIVHEGKHTALKNLMTGLTGDRPENGNPLCCVCDFIKREAELHEDRAHSERRVEQFLREANYAEIETHILAVPEEGRRWFAIRLFPKGLRGLIIEEYPDLSWEDTCLLLIAFYLRGGNVDVEVETEDLDLREAWRTITTGQRQAQVITPEEFRRNPRQLREVTWEELRGAGLHNVKKVKVDGEGRAWLRPFSKKYRIMHAPAPDLTARSPREYFDAGLIDTAEYVADEVREMTGDNRYTNVTVQVHVKPPKVYLDVQVGGVVVEIASTKLPTAGRGGPPQLQRGGPAGAGAGAKTEAGAETEAEAERKTESPPTAVPRASPLGVKPDRETEEFLTTRIAQSMMVYDWYLKKRRKELERRLKEEEK